MAITHNKIVPMIYFHHITILGMKRREHHHTAGSGTDGGSRLCDKIDAFMEGP